MSEYAFIGNLILTGEIRCKTALHIGGSKDAYEIGGMDNPVIKTMKGMPYIPGSSLKGKLRSLLEWSLGKVTGSETCKCGELGCEICRIFGTSADKKTKFGPTRLVVRDAFLTKDSREELEALGSTTFTEVKTETAIDRLTGKAKDGSLRPIERVPEGTEFNFSMVYSVYKIKDETELRDLEFFPHILDAMALLEDSYLGGMGSRGSGQVEFEKLRLVFRGKDYYLKGEEEKQHTDQVNLRMNSGEREKFIKALHSFLNEGAKDENPGSQA